MDSFRQKIDTACDILNCGKLFLLLGVVSVLYLIAQPFVEMYQDARLKDWTETEALVVNVSSHVETHRSRRGTRKETVWESKFVFQDKDGKEHTAIHPHELHKGESVNIIYPEANPEEAILNDEETRYETIRGIGFCCWGMLILIALSALWGAVKRGWARLRGKKQDTTEEE